MQSVATNKSPSISSIYATYSVLVLVLGIAIGLIFFIFFYGYFDQRSSVSEGAEYLNLIWFNYYSVILNAVFQYGVETGTFDISHAMTPIHLFETEDDSIFHVGRDWIKGAIIFNVDARAITRI